jgi:hypothetical protein
LRGETKKLPQRAHKHEVIVIIDTINGMKNLLNQMMRKEECFTIALTISAFSLPVIGRRVLVAAEDRDAGF